MWQGFFSGLYTVLLVAQDSAVSEVIGDVAGSSPAESNPTQPWQWMVFGVLVIYGLYTLSRMSGMAVEHGIFGTSGNPLKSRDADEKKKDGKGQ